MARRVQPISRRLANCLRQFLPNCATLSAKLAPAFRFPNRLAGLRLAPPQASLPASGDGAVRCFRSEPPRESVTAPRRHATALPALASPLPTSVCLRSRHPIPLHGVSLHFVLWLAISSESHYSSKHPPTLLFVEALPAAEKNGGKLAACHTAQPALRASAPTSLTCKGAAPPLTPSPNFSAKIFCARLTPHETS